MKTIRKTVIISFDDKKIILADECTKHAIEKLNKFLELKVELIKKFEKTNYAVRKNN